MKNQIILCDPLTKLIVQYSLYLQIFSMALLSTTLPLALTNVLLLIVMTVLVVRALKTDTQISLYKNSQCLFYLIKYGTLITLLSRYLAQFYLVYEANERIANPDLAKEEENELYQKSALLFGFTTDYFSVRLISLTLILIIANMQITMLKHAVLREIIVEVD